MYNNFSNKLSYLSRVSWRLYKFMHSLYHRVIVSIGWPLKDWMILNDIKCFFNLFYYFILFYFLKSLFQWPPNTRTDWKVGNVRIKCSRIIRVNYVYDVSLRGERRFVISTKFPKEFREEFRTLFAHLANRVRAKQRPVAIFVAPRCRGHQLGRALANELKESLTPPIIQLSSVMDSFCVATNDARTSFRVPPSRVLHYLTRNYFFANNARDI